MTATERREAIIEAAIQLFAERGFRGTTTRELAAAVGVSEPVLYQHFATKRDLYLAILERTSREHGVDRLAEQIRPYLNGADDRGFFLQLAELIVEWHARNSAFTRLVYFSALEGYELSDLFLDRNSPGFFGMVSGYIRSGIAAGRFRAVDPEIAARSFAYLVGSYGADYVIFPKAVPAAPRKEVIATMVDIFLTGLKA
jgi:AcrR family transcriptional regulator